MGPAQNVGNVRRQTLLPVGAPPATETPAADDKLAEISVTLDTEAEVSVVFDEVLLGHLFVRVRYSSTDSSVEAVSITTPARVRLTRGNRSCFVVSSFLSCVRPICGICDCRVRGPRNRQTLKDTVVGGTGGIRPRATVEVHFCLGDIHYAEGKKRDKW